MSRVIEYIDESPKNIVSGDFIKVFGSTHVVQHAGGDSIAVQLSIRSLRGSAATMVVTLPMTASVSFKRTTP